MSKADELRLPPQNLEAEQSVLGAMLLSPGAVDAAMAVLNPTDFYKTSHEQIFRAMQNLSDDGKNIDDLTLCDELGKDLDQVGGAYYITGLGTSLPSAVLIEAHCDIVLEKSKERQIIVACNEVITALYTGDMDADSAQALMLASSDNMDLAGYRNFAEDVDESLDLIKQVHEHGNIRGYSTGFIDLDYMVGGLVPGNLFILAGRPSMGKTALALGMTRHLGLNGRVCAWASLESAGTELATRLLLQARNMDDESEYHRGTVTDRALKAAGIEAERLRKMKIYVDDTGGQALRQIRARARRIKARDSLDVLFVDYLQLMSGSKHESRTQEIGEYSRGLKLLARELDIPVVALSQLNRSPEKRGSHRPMMADLRDSGDIEQDADVIAFIYRPIEYNITTEMKDPFKGRMNEGVAEIIIAKHRNGPTGTVEMTFIKKKAQFFDRSQWDPKRPYNPPAIAEPGHDQVAEEEEDIDTSPPEFFGGAPSGDGPPEV